MEFPCDRIGFSRFYATMSGPLDNLKPLVVEPQNGFSLLIKL